MRGVGRLQVHGICSLRRLVRREVVETHQTIRELAMSYNYYIENETFNVITILFFN